MTILELVGPNRSVQIFGVKLVGVNAENGKKLLFSVVFTGLILLLNFALKRAGSRFTSERRETYAFWVRQAVQVFTALFLLVGLISIWFDDPTRLATAA